MKVFGYIYRLCFSAILYSVFVIILMYTSETKEKELFWNSFIFFSFFGMSLAVVVLSPIQFFLNKKRQNLFGTLFSLVLSVCVAIPFAWVIISMIGLEHFGWD